MAPGAPKGKRKVTRGGGKNFSRILRPLDDEDIVLRSLQPRDKSAC
jgi:hypothetical protein